MNRIKIGICARSLGLPLRSSLQQARQLGIAGVELDAAEELAPKQLSDTGRRELQHLLRAADMELAALACPLRHGLDAAENQEARIDHVRQVMRLSYDLGPRRIILHAGRLTEDLKDPGQIRLREGLTALGQHGDRIGVTVALATGVDSPSLLGGVLAGIDSGSLAVSFHPAHLLMNGHDPFAAARILSRQIVHAHAGDARTPLSGRTPQEVPLGHGDVDWLQVLATLEEIGYRGWLVVDTTAGSPAAAAAAVSFLRRLTG